MFGQLLRQVRREAGLTQTELAQLAGTSQPTVSDYESDRVSPSVEVAQRLVAAAGRELTTVPAWTRADRRSLALARLYSQRLLNDPDTVRGVARRNIDTMRQLGPQVQPWVNVWDALLGLPIHVLADLLVDEGEFARALRPTNPFAGVVDEADRLAVVSDASYSCVPTTCESSCRWCLDRLPTKERRARRSWRSVRRRSSRRTATPRCPTPRRVRSKSTRSDDVEPRRHRSVRKSTSRRPVRGALGIELAAAAGSPAGVRSSCRSKRRRSDHVVAARSPISPTRLL